MVTDEIVAKFKNASMGYYNLHNLVGNEEKLEKKIYGELDDKQQKQFQYIVCGEYHVLKITILGANKIGFIDDSFQLPQGLPVGIYTLAVIPDGKEWIVKKILIQ